MSPVMAVGPTKTKCAMLMATTRAVMEANVPSCLSLFI